MHHAGCSRLDLPGDADAHRIDGLVDLVTEQSHRLQDGPHDGIRSPSCRQTHACDDRARGVDGDGIRLRPSDVEPGPHRPASLREAVSVLHDISP